MKTECLHPADQLADIMNRIYHGGMTTTSGGNLSILDDDGDIWITPSGVDKGTLTHADICRVAPDGTVLGAHRSSVELPFHALVYRRRPDLRAVLHAHPPHLVAFSVARRLPDLSLTADMRRICGGLSMAAYAVPGSEELGAYVAAEFEKGFDVVLLENHGVCIGADSLPDAFMKFETLETAAALELNACRLGTVKPPPTSAREQLVPEMDDLPLHYIGSEERAARRDMAALIQRACRQKLFGSALGDYSAKLSDGSFLITPRDADRAHIDGSELVLIRQGQREPGKTPPRSAGLHSLVYQKHPNIHSVIGAFPPHAMAFAVTEAGFDPRTIPESYIQLREVREMPFAASSEEIVEQFSERSPTLILKNRQILITGASPLQAFERLEVMEATARSILAARDLGGLIRISEQEVRDIDKAFGLS